MSSYLWHWKHNLLHHSYPNVLGFDDDVDLDPIARLHPEQRLRWFHRWQHIYIWPLYSLATLHWALVSDIREFTTGRIGGFRYPPFNRRESIRFFAAKGFFLAWAFAVPAYYQGFFWGLVFLFSFELTGGFVAAVAFQLAHAVEEADHMTAPRTAEVAWEERQLSSTVDFAIRVRWLAWYLGGLNYQAVHHLFPALSHAHYPQVAEILESTAARHGLRYCRGVSPWLQLRSHFRLLRSLGRAPSHAMS